MSVDATVNDLLVKAFNHILRMEEQTLCKGKFAEITVREMHVIENIGLDRLKMNELSKKLQITMGTLTTAINHLVKKGYVKRERTENDRRVVYVKLTDKGIEANEHHEQFHRVMVKTILANLNKEETKILTKALEGVVEFFVPEEER